MERRGEEKEEEEVHIDDLCILKKEEKNEFLPVEIFLKSGLGGTIRSSDSLFHSTHPPFVLKDI